MAWYRSSLKQSGGGSQIGDLLALASAGADSSPVLFDMDDATLGSSATKIPATMFMNNDRVAKLDLSRIESVGAQAFSYAGNLKYISLPACTSIAAQAFEFAGNDSTAILDYINLPNCVTLGDSVFRNIRTNSTTSHRTRFILTSLETTGATCFRCNNNAIYMEDLYLPAIKSLGNMSFANTRVDTLRLGPLCQSVGNNMLSTSTVTNLIVEAASPPTCGGLGTAPSHIYVPDGSVGTYKSASGWSAYSNIIESINNL